VFKDSLKRIRQGRPGHILAAGGRVARWLLLTLVGVIIGYCAPRYINKFEVGQPYVALVMSPESSLSPVSKEFMEGWQAKVEGKSYLITTKGVKVLVREFDDLDSPEDAGRYAEKLLNDPDCVLVIGNSNSTLTSTTLDVFMRQPQEAPAMIMPIATADDLVTRAKASGYKALLRMPPADNGQAELISRLAIKVQEARQHGQSQPYCRIGIYGDSSNQVYSTNLIRLIAEKARKRGAHILTEELIGVQHSFYSSITTWQSEALADVLVYVGNTHHGLLLCDQLQEIRRKTPVILSDGCMAEDTLKYMRTFPSNVFLTSPLREQETDRAGQTKPLTYRPFGEDAYLLVNRILNGVASVTRSQISKYLEQKRSEISMQGGAAGNYRFDDNGNNTAIDFHAYQITEGKLRSYKLE
jgi:ABC-type branched-subunit amino acid transport system substrate-binding protein